jgi:hypothetical protein
VEEGAPREREHVIELLKELRGRFAPWGEAAGGPQRFCHVIYIIGSGLKSLRDSAGLSDVQRSGDEARFWRSFDRD